jgi:FAD/FMN-containing dehydrogenase
MHAGKTDLKNLLHEAGGHAARSIAAGQATMACPRQQRATRTGARVLSLLFLASFAHALVPRPQPGTWAPPPPPFPCASAAPGPQFWAALRAALRARAVCGSRLVTPEDADWTAATGQWDTVVREPLAVVYAGCAEDVATAVLAARAAGLCVVPRSSGHSWGAQSVLDGRIVLDMSLLNDTQSLGDRLVRVGPGTQLRQLVAFAEPRGLLVTWGGCGQVRLGGYLQGGGEGNAQRVLGAGLDAVVSFDIVLPNGTLARGVSDGDLFWAVRGGGGPGANFGIVTSFVLHAHEAEPVILSYNIHFATDAAVEAAFRCLGVVTPNAFGAGLVFNRDGTLRLTGWWYGDPDEGQLFLYALTSGLAVLSTIVDKMSPYEASERDFRFWDRVGEHVFLSASKSMELTRTLDRADIEAVFAAVATAPPVNMSQGLFYVEAFLSGGKVNEVGRQDTAYVHRTALADFEIGSGAGLPASAGALTHSARPVLQALS